MGVERFIITDRNGNGYGKGGPSILRVLKCLGAGALLGESNPKAGKHHSTERIASSFLTTAIKTLFLIRPISVPYLMRAGSVPANPERPFPKGSLTRIEL